MIQGAPPSGSPRPLFRSLGIASSGLTAQRTRIDTIATNLANAETTRTPEGGPYRRRVVLLQEAGGAAAPGMPGAAGPEQGAGVRVAGVVETLAEGPVVYDPGHPDADEAGYVRLPNVNISEELIDLLASRRLFEANASVFQAVKAMLRRAAQI